MTDTPDSRILILFDGFRTDDFSLNCWEYNVLRPYEDGTYPVMAVIWDYSSTDFDILFWDKHILMERLAAAKAGYPALWNKNLAYHRQIKNNWRKIDRVEDLPHYEIEKKRFDAVVDLHDRMVSEEKLKSDQKKSPGLTGVNIIKDNT